MESVIWKLFALIILSIKNSLCSYSWLPVPVIKLQFNKLRRYQLSLFDSPFSPTCCAVDELLMSSSIHAVFNSNTSTRSCTRNKETSFCNQNILSFVLKKVVCILTTQFFILTFSTDYWMFFFVCSLSFFILFVHLDVLFFFYSNDDIKNIYHKTMLKCAPKSLCAWEAINLVLLCMISNYFHYSLCNVRSKAHLKCLLQSENTTGKLSPWIMSLIEIYWGVKCIYRNCSSKRCLKDAVQIFSTTMDGDLFYYCIMQVALQWIFLIKKNNCRE